MNSRERFEQAYADRNDVPLDAVQGARMKDGSYAIPRMASAWRWFQIGIDNVEVPLPPVQSEDDQFHNGRCAQFIRAAGLKVMQP